MFQRIATLATISLVLSGFGCGGRTKGTVSGKVTLDGKVLKLGSVFLVGEDKISHTAAIQPNGTYEIDNIPFGNVQVSVHSPEPQDPEVRKEFREGLEKKRGVKLPERPSVNVQDWFPIPEHYSDLEKSGLSFTMDLESKTFDIQLTRPAEDP